MQRTNIYLTEAQTEYLRARAAAAGTTRSAVLRELIDSAAAQPVTLDAEIQRAFAELADNYGEVAKRLFGDDPELSINLIEIEAG